MQELRDKKTETLPRSGRKVSRMLTPQKSRTLFNLFTSSSAETRGKNSSTVLKAVSLKSPDLNVSRADLDAVKSWVALEEKIVHGYKRQKRVLSKKAASLPPTPAKQPQFAPRASLLEVNEWVALEEKIVHQYKEQPIDFPESVGPFSEAPVEQPGPAPLKISGRQKKMQTSVAAKKSFALLGFLAIPRASLAGVNRWVALEEKIVHSYKEPKAPRKQSPTIFAPFNTQTSTFPSHDVSQLIKLLRDPEKILSKLMGFLPVLGWFVAGVLVLWSIQGAFSNRDTAQDFSRIQNEKKKLSQSYAQLQNIAAAQRAEMKWLKRQIYDMTLALKTGEADKASYAQSLEKKHAEELASLKDTVQTQNAIVSALKAQSQAFENIIEQANMSAAPIAASELPQGSFEKGGIPGSQGKVTSVNVREGFAVINLGTAQGARPGRWIKISRSGIGLAAGRIDRAYPTMSTAVLRDTSMLQLIQDGDSVFFS